MNGVSGQRGFLVAGLLFPTFSKTKEEEVPYNKFIEMLDKGEGCRKDI